MCFFVLFNFDIRTEMLRNKLDTQLAIHTFFFVHRVQSWSQNQSNPNPNLKDTGEREVQSQDLRSSQFLRLRARGTGGAVGWVLLGLGSEGKSVSSIEADEVEEEGQRRQEPKGRGALLQGRATVV